MITDRDLAAHYARDFHLEPRCGEETAAQFRERVARELYAANERAAAHAVLFNTEWTGDDSLAWALLEPGHGNDAAVRQIAEQTQANLEGAAERPRAAVTTARDPAEQYARDLAEQYARRYGVAPRRHGERAAQFRVRVARELHAAGKPHAALGVLFNLRLGDDAGIRNHLWASGKLDDSDAVAEIAKTTQSRLDQAALLAAIQRDPELWVRSDYRPYRRVADVPTHDDTAPSDVDVPPNTGLMKDKGPRTLRCRLLGCDWHDDLNPVCRRCHRALADEITTSGAVHLRWGRYGYVRHDDRPVADIKAELRRLNCRRPWRR